MAHGPCGTSILAPISKGECPSSPVQHDCVAPQIAGLTPRQRQLDDVVGALRRIPSLSRLRIEIERDEYSQACLTWSGIFARGEQGYRVASTGTAKTNFIAIGQRINHRQLDVGDARLRKRADARNHCDHGPLSASACATAPNVLLWAWTMFRQRYACGPASPYCSRRSHAHLFSAACDTTTRKSGTSPGVNSQGSHPWSLACRNSCSSSRVSVCCLASSSTSRCSPSPLSHS